MKVRKIVSVFVIFVFAFVAMIGFAGSSYAKAPSYKFVNVIEFVNGKLKLHVEQIKINKPETKKSDSKKNVKKDTKKKKTPKVFYKKPAKEPAKEPTVDMLLSPTPGDVAPQVPQEPQVPQVPEPQGSNYPWHYGITTTEFWLGELPSEDNNWISNVPTAWEDPVADSENAWYVAVPYNDIDDVNGETVNKESAKLIPWYDESLKNGYEFYSYIKNRWVMVKIGDKVAYGQVEDSGPFSEEYFDYVILGGPHPKEAGNKSGSGFDISPAMDEYLGLDGLGVSDWKFVEFSEVPAGPWREHVETQQCVWGKYGNVK